MSALDRQEVLAKLRAWQAGEIDSQGIWQWALQSADQRTTNDTVISSVMEMLCALPQDLWIEEESKLIDSNGKIKSGIFTMGEKLEI